ncbi:tyrosine-type recombinase/integrase [Ornithinibacillus sp. 179-J 7C1 HS]|uniref:tyrosine-type recombinase/integrase n=1 Tax=Ornithinibacillus sp. 179-J 7C1 HS TaxID=3142384 RepID=UPI00399F6F4D
MGVIKDRQTSLGTVYERYDSNNELIQKFGIIGFIKLSTVRRKTYFIITDLKGNLIEDANIYLNEKIGDDKYKKRETAFSALKVFYSFLELVHIDNLQNLTNGDIRDLRLFLEGGKKEGSVWSVDLRVRRDNQTYNNYLNVYRNFLEKMYGIRDSFLFETIKIGTTIGNGFFAHAHKGTQERYKANKKVFKQQSVPKYIKPYQYERIMDVIEESYGIREKVIIDLMYNYGLRIGEVLGLTFEDIVPSYKEGYYNLIIRDRVSDKPTQRAKGVITPTSKDEYNDAWYREQGNHLGYQTVLIEDEMAELIQEYIDESRDDILLSKSPIKRENLKNNAKADRVSTTPLVNNENQYIFLNHQHYTPITQAGWGYVLRGIFKEAGIHVDKGSKSTNLSHRFRHAFAMNRVKNGMQILELQKELRHASPKSCEAYYNPDDEDKVELLRKNNERYKEPYDKDKNK